MKKIILAKELVSIIANFREESRKIGVLINRTVNTKDDNKVTCISILLPRLEDLQEKEKEKFEVIFKQFKEELEKIGANTTGLNLNKKKPLSVTIPENLYTVEEQLPGFNR